MLSISSPEFENGQGIPPEFTAEGDDILPDLRIDGVPDEALSFVLIIDDPDAPNGVFTHLVAFDIPTGIDRLSADTILDLATFGSNSLAQTNYIGPNPPIGSHRFFFRLFAINDFLGLEQGVSRSDVELYMRGKIVAQAELVGTYQKRGKDDGNSEYAGQVPGGLEDYG